MTSDKEGKKLLAEFQLNGFVNKEPIFFDPIKNMLSVVEIETVK
jgi:hypothetical protein